ncbi:MAG: hypothetical protein IKB93_11340 [Clostridia bacterium]|nr:hypothetical protein [Clostridia bacterium]
MNSTILFSGYNEEEDFRILIRATGKKQASKLAEEYRLDSKFDGSFEIQEIKNGIGDMHFDCDYVIA